MFTKRIIPCLDVHNGRVVKGVNFVDLIDAGDPVEIARHMMQQEQMRLYFWISQHRQMREKLLSIWCGKWPPMYLFLLQLAEESGR